MNFYLFGPAHNFPEGLLGFLSSRLGGFLGYVLLSSTFGGHPCRFATETYPICKNGAIVVESATGNVLTAPQHSLRNRVIRWTLMRTTNNAIENKLITASIFKTWEEGFHNISNLYLLFLSQKLKPPLDPDVANAWYI